MPGEGFERPRLPQRLGSAIRTSPRLLGLIRLRSSSNPCKETAMPGEGFEPSRKLLSNGF